MAESDKEIIVIALKPYLVDNDRFDKKMQSIAIDLILTICFQMGYNYLNGGEENLPIFISP